jgi:hypothetical protein
VSGEKHLVKQFEDDAARKSEGSNVFTLAAFHPCPEELSTAEENSTASIGYDVFFSPATVTGGPAAYVLEFPWVKEAGVTTVEELQAFLRKKDPEYEKCGRIRRDNLEKHGCGSWYDWNINKWGTKWDIDCTDCSPAVKSAQLGYWYITYYFDSAWSPPVPVIKKISAIYTRLTFTLTYAEQGNDYEGRVTFEDGVQTENLEQGYSGDLLERDYF